MSAVRSRPKYQVGRYCLVQKIMTSGLSTIYLKDLGDRLFHHFSYDVISSDELDITFSSFGNDGKAIIVNTLRKDQPFCGHWLAMIYQPLPKKTIHFFCPYGLHFNNYVPVKNFLLNISNKCRIICHQRAVQSMFSTFCGFFALSFLLHFELGLNTSKFFSIYDTKNLHLNDDITVCFVKEVIKEVIGDGEPLVDH